MTTSAMQPTSSASSADKLGADEYALTEYSADQWWFKELEGIVGRDRLNEDQYRGLNIARQLIPRLLAAIASQPIVPQVVQAPNWRGLSDAQWVNLVNHEQAYINYDKDDAVHLAVKLTEIRLRENNAAPIVATVPMEYLTANSKWATNNTPMREHAAFEDGFDAAMNLVTGKQSLQAQPSDATAQPIMGVLESFVNEVALGAYTQDELRPKALQALHRYKAAQPIVDLTDERAWQIAVDLFGTVCADKRGRAHIELYRPSMAGEYARTLLANTAQGKTDQLRDATKLIVQGGA